MDSRSCNIDVEVSGLLGETARRGRSGKGPQSREGKFEGCERDPSIHHLVS